MAGCYPTRAMPSNTSGYAVGWGTLALINAGLAQGKGRRGLMWFLISLLLGPVATFLIVLLPTAVPGETDRLTQRQATALLIVAGAILTLLLVFAFAPGLMLPRL